MGRAIKNGYNHYWCTLVGDKNAAEAIHAARRAGRGLLDYLLRAHIKARKPLKTLEEREAFDMLGLKHLPSMHDELCAVLAAEAYGRAHEDKPLQALGEPQEAPQQPQGATKGHGGTPG